MPSVLKSTDVIDLTQLSPGDAVECPTCQSRDNVYNRRIHHSQAEALQAFYKHTGGTTAWFYKPEVLKQAGATSRDDAMLKLWGLTESQIAAHGEDGEVGYWRLTPLGLAFAEGRLTVPRSAVVYRGAALYFTGEQVNLADCLDSHFDRAEIYAQ